MTSHSGSHAVGGTGTRSVNQIVALVFGAVYTLVAILGFFVAETFAETDDEQLLGIFEVNHLHNIVHLVIGLVLLAASRRHDLARTANLAIGVVYVVVGIVGFLVEGTDANILALNNADQWLHLVSGAALAAVALLADKTARARA